MPVLLQINSAANMGSTGHIAEQIGSMAIAHGWTSYLAYGRMARASQSKLYHVGGKWNSMWHGVMTLLFDKHCLSSSRATRKLIAFIQKIHPDVIHLHNIHGYYLNMEILFKYLKEAGIPVVWTLHDCWAFTGHCSHYSNIGCSKWKLQCFNCPKRGNYPQSLFVDASAQRYALKKQLFNSVEKLTLVPVSKWLGDEVKESFLGHQHIEVIYNGVDTKVFYPVVNNDAVRLKYDLGEKPILLGVATAWGAHKGWQDYIKLSQSISDTVQIVMVGVSKKQSEGLPSCIKTIERTENQQELAELYSCAEIVLNLSKQESFGLTTVEGFACGTPSIVYNCTASPELVTPETGIVVPHGNINYLVNAINEILFKGKSAYSTTCRQRAVAVYDIRKQYQKYIQLYNRLVGYNNIENHV